MMLHNSTTANIQWDFQLAQVCSAGAWDVHSYHASVMLLVARVCLVPVVTMAASKMVTPATAQILGIFLIFLCIQQAGS